MEWDLSLIFNEESEIDTLIEQLDQQVTALEKFRDQITGFDGQALASFLDHYETYHFDKAQLTQYPSLRISANANDTAAVTLQNRVSKINTAWNSRLAFVPIELGALLQNRPAILDEEVLANRRYFLQRLKEQSQYRLTEAEEIIILEKDQYGCDQWSRLQGDLVSKTSFELEIYGEVQQHSWSSGYGLRSHQDHHTRKAAVVGLGKGLQKNADTYAFALRNVSANYTTEAKRRGYPNYMESSLHASHLNKRIIDTMFEVLLEHVDLFQEFLQIKAQLLGTEVLRGEDLEAPFPFSIDRTISWEEAQQVVIEGFTEFSPEFGEVARHMFEQHRVDGKPRAGKRAGAFCSTQYARKSAFIMLSYNDNMDSLGTLAHEMGHAVHAHYITRNQPLLHSDMGMPLAETASEFGSLLFNLKFMREAQTDEERKAVLFNMVENFMITIFEVGSRTLFETSIYEALDNDEYLDVDKINELYWQARAKTFGSAIDWLPEQAYHWCWKPHYYITGLRYYNYPYVFGDFSVLGMYAQYRKDPDSFVTNYTEFLKAGGSRFPAEMFGELFGFDLESRGFWEAGMAELREFVEQCKEYLQQEENLAADA